MLGVQAAVDTPALIPAVTVTASTPYGIAAVLLPGTGASTLARPHAAGDASKPRPRETQVDRMRQDTPQQHNLQKLAYNRIAAASGGASGPHPAWDPV